MRTRFFLPLIIALALVAGACGSSTDVATEPSDDATNSAESTDSTEAPPATAETTTQAPVDPEPEPTTTTTTTEAPADTEPAATETTEPAATETTEPAATETTEPAEPGAIDGALIYAENCTRCHADDGSGGRGSSLQGIAVEQPDTAAGIEQTTLGGNGMPAFAEGLTAEEIEAVVNYIWATF